MIPNPILKVLSTLRLRNVKNLLMGGQACVFYGAAEFSRDTDIVILAEPANLRRLTSALDDLKAEVIAVPPFHLKYLIRGHAVHFRCSHPDVYGMRIDVMSVLRNVDPFPKLWERRTTVETDGHGSYDLMSIPDLIQAKKTQRDKDWPMIRRLVEANYFEFREKPDVEHIEFWFKELRTPELLIEISKKYPKAHAKKSMLRPLLKYANVAMFDKLSESLFEEELAERKIDMEYWKPLKDGLEKLRRKKR